ncbi:MAG TPA: transposase [Tepidisphaeraceae bacterium]|nr:transposase [Tepidisphaeraceae bacterium]
MNYIAFDVHCAFCEGGWVTESGKEKRSWRVATTIPALAAVIAEVPRPRLLVIEEGPLADWLVRELSGRVDQVVVADPYRNALIAKEGDKDDAIDWRKLAHLARGGYVKAVHHGGDLERSVFKQHVQLYHRRVRLRHAEALRVVWRLRRFGLTTVKVKDLDTRRDALLSRLPDSALLRRGLRTMLEGYDLATAQLRRTRREMAGAARAYEPVERFMALPGVKAVRAATFFAVVDTPFRFKSKQALWKYLGIGLERRRSGNGPLRLRVPPRCNRLLKNVILGAAKSAAASGDNPFADLYERHLGMNCSPRIARRNVARSMAAVMWGMWKSGSAYDPSRVGAGQAAGELTGAGRGR